VKTEAQIQWMQIKVFGLEPLGHVIDRFGAGAAGAAAATAKQLIMDWVKKAAPKIIEYLWS
jgi:hypothetical protein